MTIDAVEYVTGDERVVGWVLYDLSRDEFIQLDDPRHDVFYKADVNEGSFFIGGAIIDIEDYVVDVTELIVVSAVRIEEVSRPKDPMVTFLVNKKLLDIAIDFKETYTWDEFEDRIDAVD